MTPRRGRWSRRQPGPLPGRGGRWSPAAALGLAGLLVAGAGVAVLASPPALRVAGASSGGAAPVAASPPAGVGAPAGSAAAGSAAAGSAAAGSAAAGSAAAGSASAAGASPTGAGTAPAAGPADAPAGAAVAAPTRLTVRDLAVTADVVPVGTDDAGALEVPADPRVAGWWASGSVPGAARGSTVVAAHVDSAELGAGPLAAVLRAPVGTTVEVTTAAGTVVRYAVTEIRTYPKSSGLPADLFAADGPARLVVITCSGDFRDGHYTENAVVLATPV